MDVKVWVCRECTTAVVSGVEEALRESAVWDSAWDSGRYLESVAGRDLVFDVEIWDEDGFATFSASDCELCGSGQSGMRFRLAVAS